MINTSGFRAVRKFLFAVSLLLGMTLMPFATHAMEVNGIARLGFDFGGESMVKVYFVGGGSDEIKANDGMVLAGGVSLTNDARNFALDATLGWKGAGIDASGQDFEFTRTPLDVLGFYVIPLGDKGIFNLRIGAGVTYIMNPKFTAKGYLVNGTIKFDNAVGFAAQIDTVIKFRGRMGVNAGLRFTGVEYEASDVSDSVNGNGAGLFVSWLF